MQLQVYFHVYTVDIYTHTGLEPEVQQLTNLI